MLKKHFYIARLIIFLGIYFDVNAQSFIRNFYLQQIENSVKINFIIANPPYCTGYQIQKADEPDGEFNVIYNYSSVCSDDNSPKNVIYFDTEPIKNDLAYYRIYVAPSIFSSVQSITYYESSETGYILYSNPINELFKLKVNSPFAGVEFYNGTGRKILDFIANSEGLVNENIALLPDGIYYFLIRTSDNLILKGKVVKAQ